MNAAELEDLFAVFGRVNVRRMFGGHGIYADGVMFALEADDSLYLKADAETQPNFVAEGCGPLVYEAKGRQVVMSYWRVPDRLLDDPSEMADWARAALDVARRAAAAKRPRKRSTGS